MFMGENISSGAIHPLFMHVQELILREQQCTGALCLLSYIINLCCTSSPSVTDPKCIVVYTNELEVALVICLESHNFIQQLGTMLNQEQNSEIFLYFHCLCSLIRNNYIRVSVVNERGSEIK